MLSIRKVVDGAVRQVDPADLAAAMSEPGFVWIDLEAPTDEEERVLLDVAVDLDPMIIEDMREDEHLPKLDVYRDQIMLTVHGLEIERSLDETTTIEVDIAMKESLLVTFHEQPVVSVASLRDRFDRAGALGIDRPALLLHRILDVMNDVFVPFFAMFEQRLDVIEEDVLSEPTEETRRDIYALQRDVIQLRRVVVPQAEVIRRIGRNPTGLLRQEDLSYFRDIYDHLFRMAELSDSYRQLLDSAMDSYRSSLNDTLNDMLRVLTLVSATLLPLSVIAGIYGTNFVNVPELEWSWGYFAMLGLFVAIIVGQIAWFRARGWIGQRAEQEARRRRALLPGVLEIPVVGKVLKIPSRVGGRALRTTRSLLRRSTRPER